MGFDQAMSFRTCPWCGLQFAQMQVHNFNVGVPVPGQARSRFWAWLTCPACGGAVSIEHSPPGSGDFELLVSPQPGDLSERVEHLPQDVEAYYQGAVKVLRAGVPDAAAVQLRRTLEAAAAHFDIKERTLVKSAQKMIDQGLVTAAFGGVLHHVRIVGNQGAHATDENLSEEQVQQALRFTTQLLRNLFEVPAELAALTQDDEAENES